MLETGRSRVRDPMKWVFSIYVILLAARPWGTEPWTEVSTKTKTKQTPWTESASELYRPCDRRLLAKIAPIFADRGCHVVIVTDPYGRILGFLDRSRNFSIKYLLSCTHEAEWTPFQTHCFSENLVVLGIEPGTLDLWPRTLTTRPQRRSKWVPETQNIISGE
jgi:hypothetical protein